MNSQVVLFAVIVIADIALWIAGVAAPLSTAGRFRARAAATILLAVACASVLGWHRTAVVGALAAWLAAIVVSYLPSATTSTP